jgi:hypothetical protein
VLALDVALPSPGGVPAKALFAGDDDAASDGSAPSPTPRADPAPTPTPPRCRDTHADAQARAIRKLREREERHATELAVAQHQLRKATEKATALQVRFANKQARDAAERIFRKPFSG